MRGQENMTEITLKDNSIIYTIKKTKCDRKYQKNSAYKNIRLNAQKNS